MLSISEPYRHRRGNHLKLKLVLSNIKVSKMRFMELHITCFTDMLDSYTMVNVLMHMSSGGRVRLSIYISPTVCV